MVFDAAEFFHLAKRLVKDVDQSEVVFRTGIGRVYYAAFLCARAKVPGTLAAMGTKVSDEHWVVRAAMKKLKHPEIADKLETLSTLRKTSDYDMSTTVGQLDFDNAVALADNLLQLIGGM